MTATTRFTTKNKRRKQIILVILYFGVIEGDTNVMHINDLATENWNSEKESICIKINKDLNIKRSVKWSHISQGEGVQLDIHR